MCQRSDRCFPVNFANFLRTLYSQNTSGRGRLNLIISMVFFDGTILKVSGESDRYQRNESIYHALKKIDRFKKSQTFLVFNWGKCV